MTPLFRAPVLALVLLTGLLVDITPAWADLAADLENVNTQASALQSELAGITLAADSVCGPLNQANGSARDLVNSIVQIDSSLAAPLQVDSAVLDALDNLFVTGLGIANEALRLSVNLQSLSGAANAITLKDGIVAILQLSSDIGTMADRIGEMADRILVMSDNIGTMADRILLTQQIQNENVALTVQTVLQTQTNVLNLVSVVEDSTYNLQFADIITNGGLLAGRMAAVVFSPWTLDTQLHNVADDVDGFLQQVRAASDTVLADTQASTTYVSYDSLVQLSSMSVMLTSLATAVDGYVIAIDGLEAITSDPTLSDSMRSMLQLSADIGLMANRIGEMADQILAMADNIGLQADQIILTQQAMNTNIATVQTAILGAQQMAIGIIAARNR